MKDNIDAVLRRGETLENLQGKTGEFSLLTLFATDSPLLLMLSVGASDGRQCCIISGFDVA